MKKRIYLSIEPLGLSQIEYSSTHGKRHTHTYKSKEIEIFVYGFFKDSSVTRDRMDAQVCRIVQDMGLHAGLLRYEKPGK